VLVGGIIPDADVPALHALGIRGIFVPGSPTRDIVAFITRAVEGRAAAL
jgi:methylmalonyl-CoA mutase C-terminal domain/subunit